MAKSCPYSNPRSFVMSASNPATAASSSNLPLSMPDQPMYATVNTSCPAISCRKLMRKILVEQQLHVDSATAARSDVVPQLLQQANHLLAPHRGKLC